jgi:bla regulator protein BlaR1
MPSVLQHWTILRNIPVLFATVWMGGVIWLLFRWWRQWNEVNQIKRVAAPLEQGREVETLRRLERQTDLRSMPFLLSNKKLEPGIFGTVRPVLLWPRGLSGQLSDEQQKAIVAHEVWHAYRRDNLAAALHTLVQTVFWFHPLVWWIATLLMREREAACDEGVLSLGSEPSVFAESILTACRFCLQSPLPHVAGVSSSNLQQRIVRIMTQPIADQLSSGRKIALTLLALSILIAPVVIGIAVVQPVRAQAVSSNESITPLQLVSIKRVQAGERRFFIKLTPQGSTVMNVTLRKLIEEAYGLRPDQITGGPSWTDSEPFDITYTGGDPIPSNSGYVPTIALQRILAQNFRLALQQQTTNAQAYVLLVSNEGPKLTNALPPLVAPGATEPMISAHVAISNGVGHLAMSGSTPALADSLSSLLKTQVTDKTGLSGTYDIMLQWADKGNPAEDLALALREQMGLVLKLQQASVSQINITSVEEPAEL